MKKMIIASMFVAIAVCGAYAASLAVPAFVDATGDLAGSGRTASAGFANIDTAAFIGVNNSSGSSLTVKVQYYSRETGAENSPAANTFALGAGQGTAWRPCQTDNGQEPAAISALNMTPANSHGSAVITWFTDAACTIAGPANAIQGRLLEIDVQGNRSAYTLPAGP